MAAKYRKIDPRIWSDEKFVGWDNDTRWLWVYLLSSEQTNRIGLFTFSVAQAAEELTVGTASVRRSIGVLEASGRVIWDEKQRLIWLPRFLQYNPPAGTNQVKSLLEDVQEFQKTELGKAVIAYLEILYCTQSGEKAPIKKNLAIMVRDRFHLSTSRGIKGCNLRSIFCISMFE